MFICMPTLFVTVEMLVNKEITFFLSYLSLTCVTWQINGTSTADKQKVKIHLWLNLCVLFSFPFSEAWRWCSYGSVLYARIKFSTKGTQGWVDNICCPQLCSGSVNLNIFSPPLPIEISSNNYPKRILNSSSASQDQLSPPHLSQAYCSFQRPRGQISPWLPLDVRLAATPYRQLHQGCNRKVREILCFPARLQGLCW